MARLVILDGTSNGENGIPRTGSTGKEFAVSYYTKKPYTTPVIVKTRQIEALSEPQEHGLITKTRELRWQESGHENRVPIGG
jgi:hypothetical protein